MVGAKMTKEAEIVKETFDIKITERELKKDERGFCENCENITRFSDADDDFIANYKTVYDIQFWFNEITLCEDCLKAFKKKIDKTLGKQ